ncbi:hypothetical protein BDF14DRAFT_1757893 [Spinellus fusiger]|nr:hypothetical protein BDF14DRAFT_1757893 [Spinellus fusiger]
MSPPIDSLNEGFSLQLSQVLKGVQQQLHALEQAQAVLPLHTLQLSVNKEEWAVMQANMAKVSVYHTKILSLQSTVTMLKARTHQLQTKANKLKATKQHHLSQTDLILRQEQVRDQSITAKMMLSSSSSSSPRVNAVDDDPKTAAAVAAVDVQVSTHTPTLPTSPTPTSSTPTPTPTLPVTATVTVKKVKKKGRTRQVEIREDTSPAWIPKPKQKPI